MQFWRKLFERLGRKNYQKHIPKFKKWLKETDFFEDEYDGRKAKNIKLWKILIQTLVFFQKTGI